MSEKLREEIAREVRLAMIDNPAPTEGTFNERAECRHIRSLQAADALLPILSRAWQPIETAPKDGTRIRVKHEKAKDYGTATAVWSEVGWLCSETFLDGEQMRMYYSPTHWMHLPSPPERG